MMVLLLPVELSRKSRARLHVTNGLLAEDTSTESGVTDQKRLMKLQRSRRIKWTRQNRKVEMVDGCGQQISSLTDFRQLQHKPRSWSNRSRV
jgi:hypothetical protein